MLGVWLANLKEWVTGTTVSTKHGMDVNVINASLPVSLTSVVVSETRWHDASSTNINATSGAYVEIGTSPAGVAVTADRTQIWVANTTGQPLSIRKAADASAAASADDLLLPAAGEGQIYGVSVLSGSKLWVRSKTSTAVTSGYLILHLG